MMMINGIFFFFNGLYLLFLNTLELVLGNMIEIGYEKVVDFPMKTSEGFQHPYFWMGFLLKYSGRIFVCFVLWKLYRIGFEPINRVRMLADVGWSQTNGTDKNDRAAKVRREVQRMRKIDDTPPVYPNGWFAIIESHLITKKEVKSVQCLGETFAVFRGDDGVVNVLDAHCPHLGANMAIGGVVKGNCLECPFHGWIFSGKTGKCSHIPYAKKVPEFSKVRHWHSEECNGSIFVWYDAEGRAPQWRVPRLKEVESGEYIYRGRTEHHILSHIQEIPENGADLAHFGHLHVPNVLKGADLTDAFSKHKIYDLVSHDFTVGNWGYEEAPNEHVAKVSLSHSFSLFSGLLKLLQVKVDAFQIGPGLVHLLFETSIGNGVLIQTVTPQEPFQQMLVHRFYSCSSYLAPFAKLTIMGEAYQVERDIMIWNNKTYLSKPLLLAEDKLILKFRRWYSQFYSEHSPKFPGFRKDTLEW